MAIYARWDNEGKSFSKLFMSSMQALHNAGLSSLSLYADSVKIKIETIDEVVLFSMVAFWKGKYYCFNSYPERNGVALVYILDKIENGCMVTKVNESLASLRRLHGSRT